MESENILTSVDPKNIISTMVSENIISDFVTDVSGKSSETNSGFINDTMNDPIYPSAMLGFTAASAFIISILGTSGK